MRPVFVQGLRGVAIHGVLRYVHNRSWVLQVFHSIASLVLQVGRSCRFRKATLHWSCRLISSTCLIVLTAEDLQEGYTRTLFTASRMRCNNVARYEFITQSFGCGERNILGESQLDCRRITGNMIYIMLNILEEQKWLRRLEWHLREESWTMTSIVTWLKWLITCFLSGAKVCPEPTIDISQFNSASKLDFVIPLR